MSMQKLREAVKKELLETEEHIKTAYRILHRADRERDQADRVLKEAATDRAKAERLHAEAKRLHVRTASLSKHVER